MNLRGKVYGVIINSRSCAAGIMENWCYYVFYGDSVGSDGKITSTLIREFSKINSFYLQFYAAI